MTTITSTELASSGRYISLGNPAALNDKIKTTIVYARLTNVSAAGPSYLAGKTADGTSSGNRFYYLANGSGLGLALGGTSSGAASQPLSDFGAAATFNAWHHFIATDTLGILASGLNTYVDGTAASGTKIDGSGSRGSDAAFPLILMNRGNAGTLGRECVGDIAYHGFWDVVLNSTQIANVIANGPFSELTGLICVVANGTVYSGSSDPTNSISIVGRSTAVAGALPPNTALGTAPGGPATATTLSGPSAGSVGAASTNFTVGANGSITGTVIVTPSDAGGGGSFSPTTVSISSGAPTGTFTYTPASSGAKTISTANNGGLTNPASITYTASAAAVGTLTSGALARNMATPVGATTLTWLTIMNDATGALVVTKTNVAVNSSSVFSVSDAGMVAGTVYSAMWKESTGQRGHGWVAAT